MGQYLAIGIVTEIKADKLTNLNVEQLQERMQQQFHYVPDIYTVTDDYHFTLKSEVLHSQLIPLLETIYPLLYSDSAYYQKVLQKLQTMPASEWLQWAENKPEEAFQLDEYGSSDYLYPERIGLYYNSLAFSMEGKIGMETYGRQFNFFKYTMQQTFKQFSLAGALRVYITAENSEKVCKSLILGGAYLHK